MLRAKEEVGRGSRGEKTGAGNAGWKPECVRIQDQQSQHQRWRWSKRASIGKLGRGEGIDLELRERLCLSSDTEAGEGKGLAQGHSVDKRWSSGEES